MCLLKAEFRTLMSISKYDNDTVMYMQDIESHEMFKKITRNKYSE